MPCMQKMHTVALVMHVHAMHAENALTVTYDNDSMINACCNVHAMHAGKAFCNALIHV